MTTTMMKNTFNHPEIKLVMKTWGYEKWLVNKKEYCGKLLHFVKDTSCSLHFHLNKDETFFLSSGKLRVHYSDDLDTVNRMKEEGCSMEQILDFCESVVLEEGDNFYVPRKRIHRMTAVKDSNLYEFSTFHEDSDSYRIF